ncbi:enoyl-CoA hydratase/isomerase family protein [Desulfosporosinus fructosivorans]|uniref:Enoyl-CoA hydratase/isomerase family protein n=2 Tax=Desulfosporosinus fructosivorans TaxID=2018669 RepID=A0A4Z0RAT1_9FIRM|nr:enoyl-CoA hydratase/isomerase family protein [Desulfosporosinus fructosivorans]
MNEYTGRGYFMDFGKVKCLIGEGIASVILDFPSNLNAFDETLTADLIAALDYAEKNEAVNAIVLTSSGRAFSAGGDIGFMYDGIKNNKINIRRLVRLVSDLSIKIKKLPKPVIASIRGAAAGAGFNTALLCDFIIAADNAKFIQAFVNIGLVPDTAGAYLLAKSVGVHKATDLIMTGRVVTAKEAKDLGIVYQVTTEEELEQETMKFARKMANGPTVAYGLMKDLLYKTDFKDFEDYLNWEVEYQVACSHTDHHIKCVLDFMEKRKTN